MLPGIFYLSATLGDGKQGNQISNEYLPPRNPSSVLDSHDQDCSRTTFSSVNLGVFFHGEMVLVTTAIRDCQPSSKSALRCRKTLCSCSLEPLSLAFSSVCGGPWVDTETVAEDRQGYRGRERDDHNHRDGIWDYKPHSRDARHDTTIFFFILEFEGDVLLNAPEWRLVRILPRGERESWRLLEYWRTESLMTSYWVQRMLYS